MFSMKRAAFVVLVSSTYWSAALSASKAEVAAAAVAIHAAEITTEREKFVSRARHALKGCALLAELDRIQAYVADQGERVGIAADKNSVWALVPKCVAKNKQELLDTSRNFIQTYKGAAERSMAADMVAQWMTAIDATGSREFGTESNKFETLANRVLLGM